MTVLTNVAVHKNIKSKGKFCRNYFDNILRLFDILLNFFSTTSETMRYYYL